MATDRPQSPYQSQPSQSQPYQPITTGAAVVAFWREITDPSVVPPMPPEVLLAVMPVVTGAAVTDGLCVREPNPNTTTEA